MKQLKLKQSKTDFQQIENGLLNLEILNQDALKQIKGGTAGGEEDDGAVKEIIVID